MFAAGRDHDIGSGVGETDGDAATDAAAGAGDHGDSAVEAELHHEVGERRIGRCRGGQTGPAGRVQMRHGSTGMFMASSGDLTATVMGTL